MGTKKLVRGHLRRTVRRITVEHRELVRCVELQTRRQRQGHTAIGSVEQRDKNQLVSEQQLIPAPVSYLENFCKSLKYFPVRSTCWRLTSTPIPLSTDGRFDRRAFSGGGLCPLDDTAPGLRKTPSWLRTLFPLEAQDFFDSLLSIRPVPFSKVRFKRSSSSLFKWATNSSPLK